MGKSLLSATERKKVQLISGKVTLTMFAREMLREIPIEKIKALYGMEISTERLRTVQYVDTLFSLSCER